MSETESGNDGTTQRSGTSGSGNQPDTSGTRHASTQRGWDSVIQHISTHKIEFVLAATRAVTVLCTISYIIGIPGPASNRYKQALLMNAATSSLRLHQRMPPPPLSQISRTYFGNLIREDSFHYLIFPLMFFASQPVTLVLLPCTLYALFNLAVYAISILDKLGNQEQLKLDISNFIAKYQQSLLHTIALSELALMPIVTIGLFTGIFNLLVPLSYFRFLLLRYNSTRNAHLKLLVSQVRALLAPYIPMLAQ